MKIVDSRRIGAPPRIIDNFGSLGRRDLPLCGYACMGIRFRISKGSASHGPVLRLFDDRIGDKRTFRLEDGRDLASFLCNVMSDYTDTFYLCDIVEYEEVTDEFTVKGA